MADPSIYCTHIFGWNLMTRPDSTYKVKWCHFTMHDDHITVTINKHKTDQGGESDNKIKSFDVLVNAGAAKVNESNLKTTSKKKPLDLLFSTIYDLYTKKSKA